MFNLLARLLMIAGPLLVVLGVGVAGVGLYERRLAQKATTAQEITLGDLIARRPGNNAHVVVTDFRVCNDYVFVYRKGHQSRWERAWVPVVPAAEAGKGVTAQRTGPIRVLVTSSQLHGARDVARLTRTRALRGRVAHQVASLGAGEQKLLALAYPDTDFSRCLIVEEVPQGTAGTIGRKLMLGVILLLVGCLGSARGLWSRVASGRAALRRGMPRKAEALPGG
jgi:hypothetical protein